MLMLSRQYDARRSNLRTPLPISAVIQAANRFGCDIYIKTGMEHINVKSYYELQKGIQSQNSGVVFYFDGADEEEADVRFGKLLGV